MKKEPLTKGDWWKIARFWVVLLFIMAVLVGVALGPICPPDCPRQAKQSAAMQTSRAIGEALYQYSLDHGGLYPDGKTSTEVFQHLIDENYIADPQVFYVAIFGKVKPKTNKLKSENVSFDVTSGIDPTSSDQLPIVFLTGFKIEYEPGAKAIPVMQSPDRTWSQWWDGMDNIEPFMAVCYKGNNARWMRSDKDGSIPNFIPADFDPKGKTYRQLTP
jgi:hypothetical protein